MDRNGEDMNLEQKIDRILTEYNFDRMSFDEAKQKLLNLHSITKEYAEFCVKCDREGLPLLELDDYIKQYCF